MNAWRVYLARGKSKEAQKPKEDLSQSALVCLVRYLVGPYASCFLGFGACSFTWPQAA
jgi:hypothetical protein